MRATFKGCMVWVAGKGFWSFGIAASSGRLDLEYLGFGLHNTGLDWGLGFKVQYLGFGLHNKSVGV